MQSTYKLSDPTLDEGTTKSSSKNAAMFVGCLVLTLACTTNIVFPDSEPGARALLAAVIAIATSAFAWLSLEQSIPHRFWFLHAPASATVSAAIAITILLDIQSALLASGGTFLITLALVSFSTFINATSTQSKACWVLVSFATICATPVFLSPIAHHVTNNPSIINTIIATSPLSYLAQLLDYEYLRSPWFYQYTSYAGLDHSYPNTLAISLCYSLLATRLHFFKLSHPNNTY